MLNHQVFSNIRRLYLHMVASITPIFPYIEVLKWLIDHIDGNKCLINDENHGCLGVFLPKKVQKYYKLRDPEQWINTEFVVKFYEVHDTSRLMASWWKEENKFTNQSNGWYGTINLRDPYICLMALISQLYGENEIQLGRNNLKIIEHLCTTGSNTEGRRGTNFLHGLIPSCCHVCKECLRRHESKLAG
jgi:NAD-dependent dihydropyrimidine dehydrogenase PreA subunit